MIGKFKEKTENFKYRFDDRPRQSADLCVTRAAPGLAFRTTADCPLPYPARDAANRCAPTRNPLIAWPQRKIDRSPHENDAVFIQSFRMDTKLIQQQDSMRMLWQQAA
jgi:hypothetical protein